MWVQGSLHPCWVMLSRCGLLGAGCPHRCKYFLTYALEGGVVNSSLPGVNFGGIMPQFVLELTKGICCLSLLLGRNFSSKSIRRHQIPWNGCYRLL